MAQCSADVRQVIKNSDAIGLAARELTSDRKPLAQSWHAHRIIVGLDTCTRYGLPSAVGDYALIALDGIFEGLNHDLTAERRRARAQILKLVREMQGRKKTGVLFITHDFGVVSEIADRVVVMQLGRIVEQGPCEEVLRNPRED